MILIIGSNEETHSKYLYEKIKSRNIDVEYFDSRLYPNELFLSYEIGDDFSKYYIKIKDQKIYWKDIKGVWWRWFYGIQRQRFDGDDCELDNLVYKECKSALENLFHITDNNTLNVFFDEKLCSCKTFFNCSHTSVLCKLL